MTSTAASVAQRRLSEARARHARLTKRLAGLGPTWSAPPSHRVGFVLLGLAIALLLAQIVVQLQPSAVALPPDRLARRDALRAQYQAERARASWPAPTRVTATPKPARPTSP